MQLGDLAKERQKMDGRGELGEALLDDDERERVRKTSRMEDREDFYRMNEADDDGRSAQNTNNLNALHEWRRDHPNAAHHKLDEFERRLMASYESLDYDTCQSQQWSMRQLQAPAGQGSWDWFMNWVIFAAIGITTGAVAFLMDTGIKYLYKLKWSLVRPHVESGDLVSGYFAFAGFSLLVGLISTLMVSYGEPCAAGSGIPEVKGYLNGTNYLRFLRAKTGIIKAVGVCFSVTAGLIIGKEGPLIHIGSTCGANYATMPGCTRKGMPGHGKRWPYRFRHDRQKRDFVSGGAAAGVAAAFGAPTGGICFALEEASSFWALSLTWRTYLATMLSTSTLWLLLVARNGLSSYSALGPTYGAWDDQKKFSIWELPFFAVIAVFGGFAGAAFCQLNFYLSMWRRKHTLGRPLRRVLDVLLCVWITATINFWMPTWVGGCALKTPNYQCSDMESSYAACAQAGWVEPLIVKTPAAGVPSPPTYRLHDLCTARWPAGTTIYSDANTDKTYTFVGPAPAGSATLPSCCSNYTCPDVSDYAAYTCCSSATYKYAPGYPVVRDKVKNSTTSDGVCPHFSQAGTLSFQFTEDAIRAFFHNQSYFTRPVLVVYFLCTFFMACITYGIAVPSGLFVPCILMGSSFGRFWGECMRTWFGPSIRPDVYALIGAASMLSSVTRITITITVILFETTNQLFLIMPIMATVLLSKWIADLFNISLYDMHVELKCVPFVEPSPPKLMVGMDVSEVMTAPCVTMKEVESVRHLLQLLTSTTHNGFPVVDKEGQLRGLMLRNHLIKLLMHGKYEQGAPDAGVDRSRRRDTASLNVDGYGGPDELLPLKEFCVTLQSKNLPLEPLEGIREAVDAGATIDVRPYMNVAPMTVHPKCPISRVYTLFRGMGIRHLPITDDSNRCVGMITRKELMTDFAQDLY